jgi:hypothetical protein
MPTPSPTAATSAYIVHQTGAWVDDPFYQSPTPSQAVHDQTKVNNPRYDPPVIIVAHARNSANTLQQKPRSSV